MAKSILYRIYSKSFYKILQELGDDIFGHYTKNFYKYLRDSRYLKK